MMVVAVTVTPAETAAAIGSGAAGATGDFAAGPARIGINKHRRLLVNHRLPRNPLTGPIGGGIVASWSWIGWGLPTEANQLWHVDAVKNTSVEYYWLDAGWFDGGFPSGVGNWSLPLEQCVNKTSFPSGSLAGLGARAHAGQNRVGFIVWFEPERVAAGTYIERTFPKYVLKALAGDCFVLAGGVLDPTGWAGYQCAARNRSSGFAYIFRNSAPEVSFAAELQAIDQGCRAYTVELYYGYQLDRSTTVTGVELSNFTVTLKALPSGELPSLLLKYFKAVTTA